MKLYSMRIINYNNLAKSNKKFKIKLIRNLKKLKQNKHKNKCKCKKQ